MASAKSPEPVTPAPTPPTRRETLDFVLQAVASSDFKAAIRIAADLDKNTFTRIVHALSNTVSHSATVILETELAKE
jgi:hypothetical protein